MVDFRQVTAALFSLFSLSGCPAYDRGDCVVDRAACPAKTTCDIRSGLCVRREGEQVPLAPSDAQREAETCASDASACGSYTDAG
jgi:hypothetical protein